MSLGVELDDSHSDLGEVALAHMAGHPLSFNNPRRIGARRDRSRLAVAPVAVGLGAAMEVMAVHDTLKAAALGHPAHFDAIAFGEDRDGHGAARGGCFTRDIEATDDARSDVEARFLDVTGERFRRP